MADSGREDEGIFDREQWRHAQRFSKPPIGNELRRSRRDPQSDGEDGHRSRGRYLSRDSYVDKDDEFYLRSKRKRGEQSPISRESHDYRRQDEERHNRRNHGNNDEPFDEKRDRIRSYDSRRDVQDNTSRKQFGRRTDDFHPDEQELPELYSIHRAKVQKIRPFGVFVRIDGFYKQGLVHLSQLSDHEVVDREDSDDLKMQAIAAIACEGDQVWVKVISLKDEAGNVKIGCSLKLVSQSSGKDLDPTNVKLEQQQKNKRSQQHDPKKLILDAVYNVTCSRCGGHGHLKTECYASGGKAYALIPEEDELTLAEAQEDQIRSNTSSVMPGFGRGRSMVLPAWMTNRSGTSAKDLDVESTKKKKHKKKTTELPENVTTVEDALALIAQLKKDKKHKKKGHRKHNKD